MLPHWENNGLPVSSEKAHCGDGEATRSSDSVKAEQAGLREEGIRQGCLFMSRLSAALRGHAGNWASEEGSWKKEHLPRGPWSWGCWWEGWRAWCTRSARPLGLRGQRSASEKTYLSVGIQMCTWPPAFASSNEHVDFTEQIFVANTTVSVWVGFLMASLKSNNVCISLYSWRILLWIWNSMLAVPSFSILKMSSHEFLTSIVLTENSAPSLVLFWTD